tara:strand:+ start:716 stop:988 length:273 start_codon:yes stop_codon:yes gene_type:complete
MKLINEKLNLGQTMIIKKICEAVEANNSAHNSDFLKVFECTQDIKNLDIKDTKKSKYYLSQLIYHITCYALENDNFREVFKLDDDDFQPK